MRTSCQKLRERRWDTPERSGMSQLPLKGPKNAERCLTEPHCLFQHRVEHRGKIAGRAIDDPQHLSGCGLLLQCFARLVEQANVLDRDDSLIGEGLEEADLGVGKWCDLAPCYGDRTDCIAVLEDRHRQAS